MGINQTAIEDALIAWLAGVTGETVIMSEGNGPRPATPYATIKVTSIDEVGNAEVRAPDVNGDRDVINNHKVNVSFQFFGTTAPQKAQDTIKTLKRETGTDTLKAAGVYFFRSEGARDLSDLVRNEYEKRQGLDVVFGVQSTDSENAGLIESVNATGTVSDPSGVQVHNSSVSV